MNRPQLRWTWPLRSIEWKRAVLNGKLPSLAWMGRRPRIPLHRLPRPPLPITLTMIGLALVVASIGLYRWPRPRAKGLEQLMATASLLQSFPATPGRPVPELWKQRLGESLANQLWRQQRRTWWQLWGGHDEAPAILAIPATALGSGPGSPLPANALKVGNLLVVAPDPLSRQLLADRLRPRLRPSRGLQRRCLGLLENDQAVYWNPNALGVITGLMAPFLQRFQEGCLSLALDPQGLRWQGEASAVDGLLIEASLPSSSQESIAPPPLAPDLLLELEGPSLDLLFEGLLSRQMIREPLATVYGIDKAGTALLKASPFRLRLRPRAQGAFQASLELQVVVGPRRQQWEQQLTRLAKALQSRDLKDAGAAGGRSTTSTIATWSRSDGVVVGGWRWLSPTRGSAQLLLFLGPVPSLPLPMTSGSERAQGSGNLLLRTRPAAMASLGLLPAEMPQLVKRSDQLWFTADPLISGQEQPVSRLKGGLQLKR